VTVLRFRTTTAMTLAAPGFLALGLVLFAPAAAPQTAAPACSPQAISLSRTVEINTTGGPRFGQQQYKDQDFLKDGEIVLTFDDGPSSVYTPKVLAALEAHCTKATFFMVGSRASAEHRIVKDVARRGHTIGTHTWSHANLRSIGAVRAKDEIELGISGVQRALGQPIAPFFRFPYLSDSTAMKSYLQTRNVAAFSIDADAYDYKTLNPAEVHRQIINQITAQRKGIILFHDIQPATAGALSGLLTDLKARGFRVVHMVPDKSGTTQPAYDVMAARDSGRRLVATTANPLVKRSVTWPMADVQSSSPTGRAYEPPPGAYYPPPASARAPLPPQPLPQPRRRDDDNWLSRIFGN
jgi:peptidoglycan-N-acetylglucosamine deacetylase